MTRRMRSVVAAGRRAGLIVVPKPSIIDWRRARASTSVMSDQPPAESSSVGLRPKWRLTTSLKESLVPSFRPRSSS